MGKPSPTPPTSAPLRTSQCTLVPVLGVRRSVFLYPRSAFEVQGTSAKTTLLETTLLRTPETVLA